MHTDWCAEEQALVEVCAMLWLKKERDRQVFEASCKDALQSLRLQLQNRLRKIALDLPAPDETNDSNKDQQQTGKKTTFEQPLTSPSTQEPQEAEQKPAIHTQTLYFSFDDVEVGKEMEAPENVPHTSYNFIFHQTHQTPLKDRNLQIQWRNFRKIQYKSDIHSLDYQAIIEEVAQNKFLTHLHYERVPYNEAKLVTIIDNSSSMLAFLRLAEQIARNASQVTQNQVFYCKNLLSNYFFQDSKEQDEKPLTHDMFYKNILPKASVLFISDLGAVKGSFSSYRIKKMTEIIEKMQENGAKNIVCLNPMPEERWINTSAIFIAENLATFPITDEGVKQAIYSLKASKSLK